jgi:2-oxoglutarate ferredoxin oxidoreductase subunit alpha
VVVVSFGTAAAFVEQVVAELRDDGQRVGSFRPISLWPFPEAALAEACRSASQVLVFEVNAGQMIDDVRLSIGGRIPVRPLGRVSIDFSGMRQGEILTVPWIRDRVRSAIEEVPVP